MVNVDKSLLDKKLYEINFTKLKPIEELIKLNPRYMAAYKDANRRDKINILRAFDIQSPIEEALVQMALDAIEPVKLSATEESKVRREMAKLAAKGIEIDSPEEEAKWEVKLQNARALDKKRLDNIKASRAKQYSGSDASEEGEDGGFESKATSNNSLDSIAGLGKKSIQKLLDAGIKTAEEFHALSHDQKKTLVGALVADNFK